MSPVPSNLLRSTRGATMVDGLPIPAYSRMLRSSHHGFQWRPITRLRAHTQTTSLLHAPLGDSFCPSTADLRRPSLRALTVSERLSACWPTSRPAATARSSWRPPLAEPPAVFAVGGRVVDGRKRRRSSLETERQKQGQTLWMRWQLREDACPMITLSLYGAGRSHTHCCARCRRCAYCSTLDAVPVAVKPL